MIIRAVITAVVHRLPEDTSWPITRRSRVPHSGSLRGSLGYIRPVNTYFTPPVMCFAYFPIFISCYSPTSPPFCPISVGLRAVTHRSELQLGDEEEAG